LVVLDEADLLERELMSHVEVRLSPRRQKELGINPPAKKTVEEAWSDWVRDEALPKVVQALAAMGPLAYHSDPREIRRYKSLHQLLTSLRNLRDDLPNGGWIYDYASDRQSDIAFKPIRVDKYGPSKLWAHGGTFLLMSATIISAGQMADDLGINGQGEWEVVDIPMGFPVENRRVSIVPVVEMTKATEETGRPLMAQAVAGVLKLHEDERVLVHTVSYGLAQYISDHLRRNTTRPIVTYVEGSGKDAALKKYLGTKGAVMVAPSMDRGVDLPDEACRVQVIAKVPYPYLGDKQINARRHTRGGSTWYAVETVRTLVQMCGRGVRSETDHAETYVLDHSWTTNVGPAQAPVPPVVHALDWKFKHKVMGGVSNG
jgi:ATP-dependent DNA helicase DinG